MEDVAAGIVKAFINSGPIGLLALISLLANIGFVHWLRSVYAALGAIQERRVVERDAVVTALKSAADAIDDLTQLVPQNVKALEKNIGALERSEATLQKAYAVIRALRKRAP